MAVTDGHPEFDLGLKSDFPPIPYGLRDQQTAPLEKYVMLVVRVGVIKRKMEWNVCLAKRSHSGVWLNVYGVVLKKEILGWRPIPISPVAAS